MYDVGVRVRCKYCTILPTLVIKRMLCSHHKLLFIKCMRLIGVVFYEPLNNRLESMWSPDIFGDMMATNNADAGILSLQTNRKH